MLYFCKGVREAGAAVATVSECYGVGGSIERSPKCELLISAEDEKESGVDDSAHSH